MSNSRFNSNFLHQPLRRNQNEGTPRHAKQNFNEKLTQEVVNESIAINDVAKQKHLLAELLDKDQPDVNLSEIEDADLIVSAEDRLLNQIFYSKSA